MRSLLLRLLRRQAWSLLLLLLGRPAPALPLEGAAERHVQLTLTQTNGLPQSSVRAIAQTPDGYLWFGTEEGLVRYDGVRSTVFDTRHEKELGDNDISALAASADGALWVGTRTGLVRWADGAFHRVLDLDTPLTSLIAGKDGQVWVGTLNGLYTLASGQTRLLESGRGASADSIQVMAEGIDGTLWLGTDEGVARVKDGQIQAIGAESGLPPGRIRALTANRDGSLWIATEDALLHWKGHVLDALPLAGMTDRGTVNVLLEDRTGKLWVGLIHHGLLCLSAGQVTRYAAAQGVPSEDIVRLFEDADGDLWVGSLEDGAAELRDGLFRTLGVGEGLSENMVWSVLQANDGSLWVGTNNNGLDHVDSQGHVRVYTEKDGLPNNSLGALHEDRDGSLWMATRDGDLSVLKDGRIRTFHDPGPGATRLVSIERDHSGTLWLGDHGSAGLVRFTQDRSGQGHFEHYSVPGLINVVTVAPDGAIWVGADHGGVSRFKDGTVKTFTTRDGLLSNFAQAVYVDREGVVWAGTSPGGLNRIKDGRVTTYALKDGLFDLTVGAIVEDDFGFLWITCNNGIYRLNKQELNDFADSKVTSIHSIVYGRADGLRSAECNFGANPSVWKGQSGRLWFATTAGVASIAPQASGTYAPSPAPLVEKVLIDWKPVAWGDAVSAGPGSRDLDVQFSAPDFVAPERLTFRYKLNGFDADWVEAGGRREAIYTRLPPGQYRFAIEASMDGIRWRSSPGLLAITIRPHLWQTLSFRLISLAALLLLICFAYRWRVRYLRERNEELESRVRQRTLELQLAIHEAEISRLALQEHATKDGLTKLWNRRAVSDHLRNAFQQAGEANGSFCLIMADVDHFKRINDQHGHLAGDSILQQFAAQLLAHCRADTVVGRFGGEEFLLILPHCDLAAGVERAEALRHYFAGAPLSLGEEPFPVTCSFGVASSLYADSAEELLQQADEALYAAKRAGRNRVSFHAPGNSAAYLQANRAAFPGRALEAASA